MEIIRYARFIEWAVVVLWASAWDRVWCDDWRRCLPLWFMHVKLPVEIFAFIALCLFKWNEEKNKVLQGKRGHQQRIFTEWCEGS